MEPVNRTTHTNHGRWLPLLARLMTLWQPIIIGLQTSRSLDELFGSTVSFVGAGTCAVDADQGGDASYLAAPRAQQSFAVALRAQTI